MRECWKKGPDRNRKKNHNAHMKKYRVRKHYEQNNHLPQVNFTVDVSGQTWVMKLNTNRQTV